MADFNVNMSQPQGAGTQPLAPVQTPTNHPNTWIPFVATAASTLMQMAATKKAEEKQQQIDTVVGEFTREQTSLNDAVAQGSMTPAQAAARQRANFSKYAAQYPALVKHFKETNGALSENTDLGEFKEKEQTMQDLEKTLLGDMQKSGFPVYEGMPAQQLESFKTTYLSGKKVQGELDEIYKRNAEMRAASAEERNAYQFYAKERTGQLLSKLGESHISSTVDYISALAKEPNPEVAKQKLLSHFSMIEGNIAALTATQPELASNWNKIFADLKKAGEDAVSPTKKVENLENTLKEIKTRAQLMALSDPRIQGAYAVDALMPNMVSTMALDNKAALDTLVKFSQDGGVKLPVVGNKDIEGDIYKGINANVKALEAGTATNPDKVKQQLGTAAANVLTQLDKALGNDLKTEDLKEVVKWIASPEYGVMVDKKLVSKEQAAAAKTSFQYLYEQNVANSVVNKLKQPLGRDGKTYGDSVEFKWVGSGVVLEKKFDDGKGGSWSFGTSSAFKNMKIEEIAAIKREQQQFAKELEPVNIAINTLVKAGAHMEGHRDYGTYWEENKHRLVPGMFPDPKESNMKQEGQQKGAHVISMESLKPGYTFEGFKYLGDNKWERIQ